jgi:hypothetical protein
MQGVHPYGDGANLIANGGFERDGALQWKTACDRDASGVVSTGTATTGPRRPRSGDSMYRFKAMGGGPCRDGGVLSQRVDGLEDWVPYHAMVRACVQP